MEPLRNPSSAENHSSFTSANNSSSQTITSNAPLPSLPSLTDQFLSGSFPSLPFPSSPQHQLPPMQWSPLGQMNPMNAMGQMGQMNPMNAMTAMNPISPMSAMSHMSHMNHMSPMGHMNPMCLPSMPHMNAMQMNAMQMQQMMPMQIHPPFHTNPHQAHYVQQNAHMQSFNMPQTPASIQSPGQFHGAHPSIPLSPHHTNSGHHIHAASQSFPSSPSVQTPTSAKQLSSLLNPEPMSLLKSPDSSAVGQSAYSDQDMLLSPLRTQRDKFDPSSYQGKDYDSKPIQTLLTQEQSANSLSNTQTLPSLTSAIWGSTMPAPEARLKSDYDSSAPSSFTSAPLPSYNPSPNPSQSYNQRMIHALNDSNSSPSPPQHQAHSLPPFPQLQTNPQSQQNQHKRPHHRQPQSPSVAQKYSPKESHDPRAKTKSNSGTHKAVSLTPKLEQTSFTESHSSPPVSSLSSPLAQGPKRVTPEDDEKIPPPKKRSMRPAPIQTTSLHKDKQPHSKSSNKVPHMQVFSECEATDARASVEPIPMSNHSSLTQAVVQIADPAIVPIHTGVASVGDSGTLKPSSQVPLNSPLETPSVHNEKTEKGASEINQKGGKERHSNRGRKPRIHKEGDISSLQNNVSSDSVAPEIPHQLVNDAQTYLSTPIVDDLAPYKQQVHSRISDYQTTGVEESEEDFSMYPTVEYEPNKPLCNFAAYLNSYINVKVNSKYITLNHEKLHHRCVWGTTFYTHDSDLIAIIIHTGHHPITLQPPSFPHAVATLKISAPLAMYESSLSHGIMSRKWKNFDGYTIQLVKYHVVEEPDFIPAPCPQTSKINQSRTTNKATRMLNRTHSLGSHRFAPNIILRFNLSNEPCAKYTLSLLGDRGVEDEQLTSSRFRNFVLFAESRYQRRFELSLIPEASATSLQRSVEKPQPHNSAELHQVAHKQGFNREEGTTKTASPGQIALSQDQKHVYRWATVLNPLNVCSDALARNGLPLPNHMVHVIADDLKWEDIAWSSKTIFIRNVEYPLVNMAWYSTKSLKSFVF